jgi:CRISPR system Cascade subunit CasA
LHRQGGRIHAWREESVAMPVALLRASDERVGALIGEATALADDLGQALRTMERDYRRAHQPKTEKKGRKKPREDEIPLAMEIEFWPRLAAPFDDLLRQLAFAADTAEQARALRTWGATASAIAEQAADAWALGAPRGARGVLVAGQCREQYQRSQNQLAAVFRARLAAYTTPEDNAA